MKLLLAILLGCGAVAVGLSIPDLHADETPVVSTDSPAKETPEAAPIYNPAMICLPPQYEERNCWLPRTQNSAMISLPLAPIHNPAMSALPPAPIQNAAMSALPPQIDNPAMMSLPPEAKVVS